MGSMEELAKHIYWGEGTINYDNQHKLRNEGQVPFCCFYCGTRVVPGRLQDHQLERCWRFRNSGVVRGRLVGKGLVTIKPPETVSAFRRKRKKYEIFKVENPSTIKRRVVDLETAPR